MKNKRIIWMLTAGLTFGMLTGCGGEEKKTYDQACADLAQGSYDYALQGYQSSITAGYKTAEAYRGAGIANIHLVNFCVRGSLMSQPSHFAFRPASFMPTRPMVEK